MPPKENMFENKEEQKFEDFIPFGKGRPIRNNIINQDDITNLKIDLETLTESKNFIDNI